MLSPEDQQFKIYMLKAGLDETKNALLSQTDVLLSIEEDSEQLSEENKKVLRELHTLNAKLESMKLENVRLSAKRIIIMKECEEATTCLERTKEKRDLLLQQIKDELTNSEIMLRQYEDQLFEIAEKYRKTPVFGNEEAIKTETEKMKITISELENEEAKHQNIVQLLQRELDSFGTTIPEDIFDIVGKRDLEEKINALNAEVEALTKKNDNLLPCHGNIALFLEQNTNQ
ncbi:ERC protein 2-like [Pieris rapae]|uniref:ERC protein 2-like n=1 Tax=Pieris rapae TaxID=64459 RepID=UPI001E27DB97|nr:ERC protein 2-like [Pieris rapae]